MIDKVRPIVVAVHPNLINELKTRQEQLQKETGRPTKGGLTIFSQIAAEELKCMRLSTEYLQNQIENISRFKPIEIMQGNEIKMFVPFDIYKNLLLFSSALYKKTDTKQIRLEIQKIKGLKKNEIRFPW